MQQESKSQSSHYNRKEWDKSTTPKAEDKPTLDSLIEMIRGARHLVADPDKTVSFNHLHHSHLMAIEENLLAARNIQDALNNEGGMREMISDMKQLVDQDELINALAEAMNLIKEWHDMPAVAQGVPTMQIERNWNIYENASPEMKRLKGILAKYNTEEEEAESDEPRGAGNPDMNGANDAERAEMQHRAQQLK